MLVSLLGFVSCDCNGQKIDNTPVKALELDKYLGDWYEIARYDHSFERGITHAKAKLTDTVGLLRVSFFGPFYSDL